MTRKLFSVDVGNLCVECLRDTSFGSGLFVNRIPGDRYVYNKAGHEIGMRDGYLCCECGGFECDRCGEKILIDEDVMSDQVYGEDAGTLSREFPDGAVHICEDCLTPKEKQLMEELNDD
jgi:hypothetical protein